MYGQKNPPSLAEVKNGAKKVVVVNNIALKYVQQKFEYQGTIDLSIPELKYRRSFNLPIPHEGYVAKDFWQADPL